MRRCRQTGLPVYPLNACSSLASDQNHQQQIDGLPPSRDVFDHNISNSTVADEEQTWCSYKKQKCYRNSTCPDATVHNFEASDCVDLESDVYTRRFDEANR
ncbi:hypothetical protein ZIOFF_014170 [Zingiber officinale]|uniref:Uncharacterized protein n=1 Tax=Zingiber officinale TaxID=94328 RepID=A0A8J5LRF5_ZINOF|nr:hypothetical protein ZIOFF_014170 [Zingiber officinale]